MQSEAHIDEIQIMEDQEKIYVTGHKHPDSDSIVSAIAYAAFKQRKGYRAIACRLGEINDETSYLLKRFHFDEPQLFEDARSTLAEIAIDPLIDVKPQTTIKEAMKLLKHEKKQSLGVVNDAGKLLGIVTKSNLAEIGLDDTSLSIRLLKETPTAYIAKTVNGNVLYEDAKRHFNGKVSVVAISETKLANYELKDRLVIVGNDFDAQKTAIEKGAAILMIVWCEKIKKEIYELAKKYHCHVIKSGHGTMNTTRFLYFSIPIRLIMSSKLITFNIHEYVDEVGKKMMKTRYRSYPIIDDDNSLCGFISRFHILNQKHKKVILVDHNEYAQSVNHIEKADLLEVIDHHRVSDITTNRPINFRNEIIGSTTTIIASMYLEQQMNISKSLAGLMLGAILSDTLKFKSPTTTEKDRGIAKVLSEISEIDIDVFAKELFIVSSNIAKRNALDLIQQDIKAFVIDDNKVMVSQIIVYQVEDALEIEKAIKVAMRKIVKSKEIDLLVVAFTSILENGSIFYAEGKLQQIIKEAFPDQSQEKHSFQEDILSRKNQILPMLSRAILNSIE